ncbi:ZIP family metal transporter [Clostridium sediminicola]|uniref:ZIP family metal transporter n=1 Tax=Clostridium sediminicola TaxID=3114879 RepID=UPI0031F1F456
MSEISNTVIYASLFSLAGTMIGSIFGILISKPSKKMIANFNCFAAGIMMEVVFIELLPSSLERIRIDVFLIYMGIGIAFMYFLGKLYEEISLNKDVFLKTAILTSIGIMLHNLPEGIIMGIGFLHSSGLGATMSLVIAVHDIPEGIVVSSTLVASRIRTYKVLLYSFLTAMPTVIGCYIGVKMFWISPLIIGIFLAIVSGIMFYIALFQLINRSTKATNFNTIFKSVVFGIILGLVITILL